MPGLALMSSEKCINYNLVIFRVLELCLDPTHFTIVERVSQTLHRHRRQVIAGETYEWYVLILIFYVRCILLCFLRHSNTIPYQIWGGDAHFQNLIRRGLITYFNLF
jgi:hypothetical protein